MRQSYNGELLKNKSGEFKGVNLGSDFCAEHEWGILGLQRTLGISLDEKAIGVEKRKISFGKEVKENSISCNGMMLYAIYCVNNTYSEENYSEFLIKRNLISVNQKELDENGFVAAWNERGFAIFFDMKHMSFGKELLTACQNNDVMVYLGQGTNPFARSGLLITIISREDEDLLIKMKEHDMDKIQLIETAKNTGIYQKLRAANKRFYALTPRWKDKDKKEVLFWLNPMEQKIYNYGWFTVEDLELWIEGKGPIIKEEIYG